MLPFFYAQELQSGASTFLLDEPTSKHVVQVLRMKENEALLITNGNGLKVKAIISDAHKKHCLVNIVEEEVAPAKAYQFTLAIAFTKYAARNEWLLEKITELGVGRIVPIITDHSENDKFKEDRLNNILISAMLQSQQVYLPILEAPVVFSVFLNEIKDDDIQCFIAHCEADKDRASYWSSLQKDKDTLVFIGPEGDFSSAEIELAMAKGIKPVTFGVNRLRTETAGVYACTVFNAFNYG